MNKNNIENKQYWSCQIGPIPKNKIGWGADFPLRRAVEVEFIEMFGEQAEICSSGWGLSEEMKNRLSTISHLPQLDKGGEILKKIDKLLKDL